MHPSVLNEIHQSPTYSVVTERRPVGYAVQKHYRGFNKRRTRVFTTFGFSTHMSSEQKSVQAANTPQVATTKAQHALKTVFLCLCPPLTACSSPLVDSMPRLPAPDTNTCRPGKCPRGLFDLLRPTQRGGEGRVYSVCSCLFFFLVFCPFV